MAFQRSSVSCLTFHTSAVVLVVVQRPILPFSIEGGRDFGSGKGTH